MALVRYGRPRLDEACRRRIRNGRACMLRIGSICIDPLPRDLSWVGGSGVSVAVLLNPMQGLKVQLAPLRSCGNCCSHLPELFVIVLPDLCWVVSCQAIHDTQMLQGK